MRSRLLSVAAALACVAQTAAAQISPIGYFEVTRGWSRDDGRVQLTVTDDEDDRFRRSMSSFDIDAAKLQGLDVKRLDASGDSVRFRLVRDAGTIEFRGKAYDGRARGRYTFTPDARFTPELARRGVGRPGESEQFELALFDVGLATLDELEREKYARPTVRELVRMGTHGATLDYLRSLDALGYRVGTVDELVTLRDHGVTARYVRDLQDAGYRSLGADELRELRDHGVTASFAELARREYDARSVSEVIRLRDRGVKD